MIESKNLLDDVGCGWLSRIVHSFFVLAKSFQKKKQFKKFLCTIADVIELKLYVHDLYSTRISILIFSLIRSIELGLTLINKHAISF